MVQRSTRDTCGSSGGLLHPGMLQFHRHALSVDEPEPFARTLKQAGSHGSVQYGFGGEIVPVHKLRDRNKRSDTARRHVLSRQSKIEKEESLSSPKHGHISRRASTISNTSVSSKLNRSSRRASTVSKTPSVDSRGAASTVDINSLDRSLLQGLTPPRKGASSGNPGPISTPSVEKEYRSQLSICSEPAAISQRNLSCQSSLEPCVPEEESSPEQEHGPTGQQQEPEHEPEGSGRRKHQQQQQPAAGPLEPLSVANPPLRPDSLVLDPDSDERSGAGPNRFLYRSNSSKSFRKPKPKVTSKKRSNEYDQIYVISSANGGGGSGGSISGATNDRAPTGSGRYPNFQHAANIQAVRNADDDHYDSIEVIHERRSKNFSKFSSTVEPGQDDGRPEGGNGSVEGEYRKVGSNTISVVADISPVPPVTVTNGEESANGAAAASRTTGNDVAVLPLGP
uniref:Uncharacterized protein n=1 Tax=Anopheles atroparvus TaxID=41427 RepID=A0AAG5D6X4_ANOAO